jgi:hypothetical protein
LVIRRATKRDCDFIGISSISWSGEPWSSIRRSFWGAGIAFNDQGPFSREPVSPMLDKRESRASNSGGAISLRAGGNS